MPTSHQLPSLDPLILSDPSDGVSSDNGDQRELAQLRSPKVHHTSRGRASRIMRTPCRFCSP